MNDQSTRWYKILLILGLLALPALFLQGSVSAAQAPLKLTVIPLTWNVVGLDSNSPATGPTIYPVGVKVCNYTGSVANNVGSQLVWTTDNDYIGLRSGSLSSFTGYTLANNTCENFYYEIAIQTTPNPPDTLNDIYDSSRRFYINATATGFDEATTSKPQEIYVEHLVSQNRNSVTGVTLDTDTAVPPGGSMTLMVGETYDITLVGNTATNGYEQIESYINFPNTIFQVNSVTTTYSAKPTPPNLDPLFAEKPYADGCKWINDPASPNYRSCTGTGKYGGAVTVNYNVTIIGGGGTSQLLNTLIYDFSGSSYHYNSDYAAGARIAFIIDPAMSLQFSKAFNPGSVTPPATSRLTFTITNPTSVALSGVHFTDQLPNSPATMQVASTPDAQTSGCGSPTFAPNSGDTLLSFSNGTIAANSSCTIAVNISIPGTATSGTYLNVSDHLFVDTKDTGKTANASLSLQSSGTGLCGITMANWTFAGFTSNPPPQPTPVLPLPADVSSAEMSVGAAMTDVPDSSAGGGNPIPGVKTYGWPKDPPIDTASTAYIQFAIDTDNYSGVRLSFDAQRKNNGPTNLGLYYSLDGTSWTLHSSLAPATNWATYPSAGTDYDFTGLTNTSGLTYFRIYGYGAKTPTLGSDLNLDNVLFTGCSTGRPPELSKSFNPSTVGIDSTSTLRFTLINPNAAALTGVQFADTLPEGVTVATNTTTIAACGNGTLQTTAPNLISFSGGGIPESSSCNFDVTVTGTAAGLHTNTSGYISSTETGTNADPTTGRGTANLRVVLPPSISKVFGPNPILTGGTSTLTFTITNPNTDYDLTGVSFTDTFPTGMTSVLAPAASQCGGTVTSTINSITLTNGSIAADPGFCTVTVNVTATAPTVPTLYPNTSEYVSDLTGGTGNRAEATLTVNPITPRLSLMKQVSTSASGPWSPFVIVDPGQEVYYLFTVENTGDVPFAPVTITDATVNTAGCTRTTALPVAAAGSEAHIYTCMVGPIPAPAGETPNTATAHGYYADDPYDSNPSSASVLGATANFSLLKQVGLSASGPWASALSGLAPSTEVYYRFLVSNTGETTLTGIDIADANVDTASCEFTDPLPVGGATACVIGPVTGRATPGTETNTATAHATTPGGSIDSAPSTASYTVSASQPDLSVTKTNNMAGTAFQAIPFTWTVQVSNAPGAGNAVFAAGQTILSDPLPIAVPDGDILVENTSVITNPGNISCSIASNTLKCIAGGGTVTVGPEGSFTVSFSVTPPALGSFPNTATVDPLGVVSELNEGNNTGSDTVNVISASPQLTVTKTGTWVDGDGDSYADVGEVINYTFSVANTEDVILHNVTVTDPLVTISGGPTTLDVGETDTTTFTGTYTVTQTDIEAGSVYNLATADSTESDPDSGETTTLLPQNPALTVTKSGTWVDGDGDSYADVAEEIHYTFSVANTGNVALHDVTITDPLVTVTGGPTTLDVGETDTTTFTGSYTITQADIDTGLVYNLATADSTESEADDGNTTTNLPQNPALTLTKSGTWVDGDGDGFADVGEQITYTFTVVNIGNVTLHNVVISDPKVSVSGGPTTLDVGETDTTTFTGSYTITQADIDAGTVVNLATADSDESEPATGENTTSLPQNPALTITKSGTWVDGNGDGLADAGEQITYTFTVINTGNVTLHNVEVTDPKVTVLGGPTTLDIGEADSTTFTATYTITQADIDAGSVYNLATADSDESEPDTGENTTSLLQNPALTVAKSGTWVDGDSDGFADVGETITYSFTVTNTGNVTLHNVTVTDPKVTVTGGPATLDVGETDTTTFTGTYTVTLADVNAGSVYNLATADSTESGPDSGDTTTPLAQNPALTLAKSGTWADGDGDGLADAGETITYTFTVTNTGNVTLHDVVVTDPKVTVTGGPTTLDVGETDTTTFSATYTITQADIDTGSVYNLATADSNESGSDTDDHTANLPQNPALTVTKSGTWDDGDGDGFADVGESITYAFTVTNTGNVTLHNVTVTDPKVTVLGGPTTLDVGETDTTTFTASYTITQADIDTGSVYNLATADSNESGPDTGENRTLLPQNPALTVTKSGTWVDGDGDGFAAVGETITYSFTVTNTGNVTLHNVTVTDPMVTVLGGPATLDVGETDTTTFTATHTVTQADIDAGSVYNLATADSAESEPDTGENTTPLPQNPALTLVKSVTEAGYDAVGDVLHYSFLVTNTGNIRLAGPVGVADDQATDESCPNVNTVGNMDGFLDPGEAITCTATYTVDLADLNFGSVTNLASATADGTTSNTDSETVNGSGLPAFTIVKAAAETSVDAAGDVIHYTITLTNTGNVTLTGVTIADTRLASLSCTPLQPATLAPAETMQCTGSYGVTQSDINAGGTLDNTATGDTGQTGSQDASASVDVLQMPALTLSKSASPGTYSSVGNVIHYSYLVTNSGGVTLNDPITVNDDKAAVTCPSLPAGGLAPGASITCSATYTITQDDLNFGEVTNTAQASSGNLLSNQDSERVVANQDPDIRITKTLGEVVFDSPRLIHLTYSLLVENVGNVNLGRIQVVDDLDVTFADAASFTIEEVSTSDFTLNPGYDGDNDTNLLDESDWLAPGESGTITLKLLVDTGGDADAYTNLASATGMTPREDYVDDEDDASGPSFIDPVVTKAVNPTLASVGDIVTYTITVTNNGTLPANNVIVTDILPSFLDLVPNSVTVTPNSGTISITQPRTVTVTLGTVGVSDTFVIRIQAVVNSLGKPVTNTVQLTTTLPGGWQGNLLSNDRAAADLQTTERPPDPGEDLVGWKLPATGFAPGVVSPLPPQPVNLEYAALGDVWIEIPSLNVKAPIVGVPKADKGWNTNWLWGEAGWLDGTAFPGWAGNSVLTSHVYLSNGKPGPFVDLSKLKWGDKIIIHAYREKYTFEVRENKHVSPNDSSVLKHEEYSWLTLLTCNKYNEKTDSYDYRIAVRAVLVKAEAER